MLTATVMPRSLNDPVGFAPSTFRYTSQPVRADSTGAGSSGVAPSARVITGAPSGTGSRWRYWAITPGHGTNEAAASAAGFTLAFNFMASLAGASLASGGGSSPPGHRHGPAGPYPALSPAPAGVL